ncbi:hypothetical protein E4417_16445 [Stenotrophomonas maltophilia]|uniref:hypothetical protein n=1 Tax=Stenotrophomonas maltophilia TaxID=40324 RepID=UPI00109416BD|nr:hypothetical protein [Stenotrophomonas maltophilia]TGW16816.1 hypothetical protein E4417_16445 [Stenotrophomonas maltophilia]
MAEIYGYRWTSAYGEDPSGGAAATWAKGLAGLTGEQLAAGLGSSIASADPWPPTLGPAAIARLSLAAYRQVAKILSWQRALRENRLARANSDPPFGWIGQPTAQQTQAPVWAGACSLLQFFLAVAYFTFSGL